MEDLVNPREVTKYFFLLSVSLFPCVTCLLVLLCIYLSHAFTTWYWKVQFSFVCCQQVRAFFTLSSSDERVLSVLAEAVCLCALESTERDFLENSKGISSRDVFPWFQKPKRIASSDSSVNIYKISQDQIVESAKNSVENFNSVKGKYMGREIKQKDRWWASPTYSRLDKIGGPEFSSWTNEYIPAYRLQVNAEYFQNVKFEGWQRSVDNRWEVLLTHSQMVYLFFPWILGLN